MFAWIVEKGSRLSRRASISTILNQLREDVHSWKPIVPWEDDLIAFLSVCEARAMGNLEKEQAQKFADKLDMVRPLESSCIRSSDHISRPLTTGISARESESSI